MIDSPRKAIELRIGMVHQHFMLVDDFTVAENIVLGAEPSRGGGRLDRDAAEQRVGELARGFGTPWTPTPGSRTSASASSSGSRSSSSSTGARTS